MRLILLNATLIFSSVLSEDDARQNHKNYIKKSHPNDKKIKVVHHKSRPKNKLKLQSKKQEKNNEQDQLQPDDKIYYPYYTSTAFPSTTTGGEIEYGMVPRLIDENLRIVLGFAKYGWEENSETMCLTAFNEQVETDDFGFEIGTNWEPNLDSKITWEPCFGNKNSKYDSVYNLDGEEYYEQGPDDNYYNEYGHSDEDSLGILPWEARPKAQEWIWIGNHVCLKYQKLAMKRKNLYYCLYVETDKKNKKGNHKLRLEKLYAKKESDTTKRYYESKHDEQYVYNPVHFDDWYKTDMVPDKSKNSDEIKNKKMKFFFHAGMLKLGTPNDGAMRINGATKVLAFNLDKDAKREVYFHSLRFEEYWGSANAERAHDKDTRAVYPVLFNHRTSCEVANAPVRNMNFGPFVDYYQPMDIYRVNQNIYCTRRSEEGHKIGTISAGSEFYRVVHIFIIRRNS